MKKYLLIFFCLYLSCNTTNTQYPDNIIKEELFITVLKEIHLAEAEFELNKSKGKEAASKILANTYSEIYLTHHINEKLFEETLTYFSSHPEKLEQIYSKVIKDLSEEKLF
tara:strand:+ start:40 stop:372 length:333 start_codon:yes stop_codon:yes gene_type:complete